MWQLGQTPLQTLLQPYGLYNDAVDPMKNIMMSKKRRSSQLTFVDDLLREWECSQVKLLEEEAAPEPPKRKRRKKSKSCKKRPRKI